MRASIGGLPRLRADAVPTSGADGFVKLASGEPESHMPEIADLVEPRMVTEGARRVRKKRDDLIPLLENLAYNLRWSWDPPTIDLFQRLAPEPWARTHNPIAAMMAAAKEPDRLAEHAESILERHAELEQYLNRPPRVQDIP